MWTHGAMDCFPLMWIFPLIGLSVMLLVVYLIFRRGGFQPSCGGWNGQDRGPTEQKLDSPMEILKRRYAKGEITDDEFERVKRGILG